MNRIQNTLAAIAVFAISGAWIYAAEPTASRQNFKPVALSEREVPYSIGKWSGESGNHRALVKVKKKADAVQVHIPWRRRDTDAAGKNVLVVDSKSFSHYKICRIESNVREGLAEEKPIGRFKYCMEKASQS